RSPHPEGARRKGVAQPDKQHAPLERRRAGPGDAGGRDRGRAGERWAGEQQHPQHDPGDEARRAAAQGRDARPDHHHAERVLELATIDGARALGLEAEVGSLEPGKRADLIVVNLARSPYAAPVHHPVSALVYSAIGDEVETVVVDGRVVVEQERVLAEAQAAADALVERAGTARLRQRPWRSLAY